MPAGRAGNRRRVAAAAALDEEEPMEAGAGVGADGKEGKRGGWERISECPMAAALRLSLRLLFG